MNIERMMDIIAEFESNGRFDAWNPIDKGKGVSFGKWQFNQRGGLHGLLVRMFNKNKMLFWKIFGPSAVSFQQFKKENLNAPYWKDALLKCAEIQEFQQCQLEEAVESYAKPAAKLCVERGLKSFLWLALITDASVQYGVGGCKRLLEKALSNPGIEGVMDTFAELADADQYNRRRKLLVHPELADRAAFMWDNERWGSL